ncbi:hypothetical protein LCGC14_0438900 [marine sediment metagenome]|uniref:Uncharacterized protein n=1 Tax=marine sediment metagenome TaxID=412755 RepID=A0A0F9T3V4_9ZZZZ
MEEQKLEKLEEERSGLEKTVQDIKKNKKKSFWDKFWKMKKLEKKGMVAILFLRDNGNAERMELRPKQGMFNIYGTSYHERADCTYRVTKDRYPLVVIRESNLLPEGTKIWEEREMQEKTALCQDHVMKGIRHAERVRAGENMGGTKISGKTAVGIAIAIIIVLAFLMNYI